MQFQRNDKKRSAQPASEGRPAKDLQPTKSIRSSTARDSFSQTPHVRGKERVACLRAHKDGITPAYAGKRWYTRCAKKLPQDHPRMCGEKERDPDICINCPGSPPHVRGKVSGFCTILRPLGITPACAGKSCQTNYWLHSCRDHPRMCGEKWLARFSPFATMGSPPRMRGKETMENTQAKRTGITPAYAGKR